VLESLSLAWFPRYELDKALMLWPTMIEWAYEDYAGYCRHFEDRLRQMRAEGAAPLSVSPIKVDAYLSWCEVHEEDPAEADARARYAAHVASRGRAIPWPPNQRDQCWCGSGESYGSCCGQLRPV
jgi:hypothetical protein